MILYAVNQTSKKNANESNIPTTVVRTVHVLFLFSLIGFDEVGPVQVRVAVLTVISFTFAPGPELTFEVRFVL